MPIEANDLNGGLGVSFTARRVVTEDEYVDTLRKHLTQDKHKFEKYRYCIADWTEVSQMDVSTEAIKLKPGLRQELKINMGLMIQHSTEVWSQFRCALH